MISSRLRTRAKLKEYDIGLAKLSEKIFNDGEGKYRRPAALKTEESKYLED